MVVTTSKLFFCWTIIVGTFVLFFPFTNSKVKCVISFISSSILLISVNCYFAYTFFLLWGTKENRWIIVSILTLDACVLFIIIYLFLKRKRVQTVLMKLRQASDSDANNRYWKRFFLILITLLALILYASYNFSISVDSNYSEFLLHYLGDKSGYASTLLRFMRSISYTFHLQGVICQITLLYYFMSSHIKSGFMQLNDQLRNCSSNNALCPIKKYRDLALRHSMLCDLVIEVDLLFSPIIFVCFSQVLVSISVQVNGIVIGEEMYSGKSGVLTLFTDLCFSVIVIFIICYSGFTVMEVAADVIPCTLYVHKIMPVPDAIFNELQIILFRQISYPVTLTAGRFFTLSRDVLLTLGSAIVTYIIILMQIDQ